MRMNSLRPNNQLRHRRRGMFPWGLLLVGLIGSAVVGANTLSSGMISGALLSTGKPLWRAEASISSSLSNLALHFRFKQGLINENRELKERIEELELSRVTSEALREENSSLLRLLNRTDNRRQIVGSVLTRPSRTLYDTFIVDVGLAEGLQSGAHVFAEGGVAIGTIGDVYEDTAIVSLYSTPGRVTDVYVGEDAIAVEATGRGGGDFEIRLPRGVEIVEGSPIVFSTLGGSGVLGVVEKVINAPADPFQTIFFSSPVNVQGLRMVMIDL